MQKNNRPDHTAERNRPGYVLVVDDEEQNRTLLRDSLEAQHHEIEEAANGEEALAKVAARPPDVILLDIMMPGLDGFEICRRLKDEPRTAAIPVLMVTALSERRERLMGIAAGANDFLSKPLDLQDLILRVRNAVYAKHLFDQLQAEKKKSEQLLARVQTLRGLIPICASCKQIRDDNGYWKQVEIYVTEHSEAEFTHSICPDCARKIYPGVRLPPTP